MLYYSRNGHIRLHLTARIRTLTLAEMVEATHVLKFLHLDGVQEDPVEIERQFTHL